MAVRSWPFSLQVSHLEHADDPTDESYIPGGGNWYPPLRRRCFNIQSTTGWYIWDPGRSPDDPTMNRLRRPSAAEESRIEIHRVGTMFWDPYAHNYLHIPLDVTTRDVRTSDNFWKRPGFGICPLAGQNDIALIRHIGEHRQLPLPGPESWFEQLLPIVFQRPAIIQPSPVQRLCKLAGDLDILIALIAFSTTPDHTPQAVDSLFRPDPRTTGFTPNWFLPVNDRKSRLYQFRYF